MLALSVELTWVCICATQLELTQPKVDFSKRHFQYKQLPENIKLAAQNSPSDFAVAIAQYIARIRQLSFIVGASQKYEDLYLNILSLFWTKPFLRETVSPKGLSVCLETWRRTMFFFQNQSNQVRITDFGVFYDGCRLLFLDGTDILPRRRPFLLFVLK